MTSLDDEQLVALAVNGDQRAFAELHQRYERQVFWKTYALVRDWDVADSATHATFSRAFEALSRYKPEPAFAAWLFRIARNESLRRLEKPSVEIEPIDGPQIADTDEALKYPLLQLPDANPSPLGEVLAGERTREISQAIDGLRPEHQKAVLLDLEGVPDWQIARKLRVRLATVRSFLHRARAALRKLLKKPPAS